MTLDEVIQRAQAILPEHKKEFIKVLSDFPDGIEKWLFSPNVRDPESLYQGDIVLDLPTCYIDNDGDIVEGQDSVALISNTCDIQPERRDFLIVSPIITFDDYRKSFTLGKPNIGNSFTQIRKNLIFRFFYLSTTNDFPESFIDFSRMVSISNFYINSLKETKPEKFALTLSVYGFYLFLIKLTIE